MREALKVLRPAEPRDHPVLAEMRGDVAMQHLLMANPDPDQPVDVPAWIRRREADGLFRVIADPTGSAVGFAQLSGHHRKNRFAFTGIAVHRAAHGHGYGPLANVDLEHLAREELGLRKLLRQVRADNARAIALWQKCGYRHVGVLEAHYDDGERLHDVVVMEKLLERG